jgi:26S proteasome regulatory subunit T6
MEQSFPLILLYLTGYGNLQVHPEGKYIVDVDKNIDIAKLTPSTRVALRSGSYMLHVILPSKVDPLVNLMKVEKVPDSTYDMIGGLDQQIKEIKEVCEEFHCTLHFVVFYYC